MRAQMSSTALCSVSLQQGEGEGEGEGEGFGNSIHKSFHPLTSTVSLCMGVQQLLSTLSALICHSLSRVHQPRQTGGMQGEGSSDTPSLDHTVKAHHIFHAHLIGVAHV